MATEEFVKNFFHNKDTIARFAGFLPESDQTRADDGDAPALECELCEKMTDLVELKRNAGICDKCAMTKEA